MTKRKTKDDSCDLTEQTTSSAGKAKTAAAMTAAAESGEESSARVPKTIITPVSKRIGEVRNNLKRRGEWYQRRTGSGGA